MPTHDASIRKALASQVDIIAHREHCLVDPQILAVIGCAVGQQVRIRRSSDEYALYTVSEAAEQVAAGVVHVALAGRQRLGTSAEFDGVLDSRVAHPALAEAVAEARGEFVERVDDDGSQTGLIVLAPHGGDIERHTDQQADRVASLLAVSSWQCKGWRSNGGAFERWHITSADICERSFPGLDSVISRGFTHAVAFHGFDRSEILVGGAAPATLKQEIHTAVQSATAGSGIEVRIAEPGDGFGGDDARNIVNRLTAGGANGIQIEQSLQARADHWRSIADAVAAVYAPKLPSPQGPCLRTAASG